MINAILELVNFYAQKYHLTISTMQAEWQKKEGETVVALPCYSGEKRDIGKLEVMYDPEFCTELEGQIIRLHNVPVAKFGNSYMIFQFLPVNKAAEDYMKKLIDKHLPHLARRNAMNDEISLWKSWRSMQSTGEVEERIRRQSDRSFRQPAGHLNQSKQTMRHG